MLLAIPNFGKRISPRIDFAESLQLFSIEENNIMQVETIKVLVHSILDRINFIVRLKPDVVICDGISNLVYEKLIENNIKVIPWIHGTVEEVIEKYLTGTLENTEINKK